MKKIITNFLIDILLPGLMVGAFVAGAIMGIEKKERIECRQWQIESQKYPSYWTTQWQKDQCKNYNIILK